MHHCTTAEAHSTALPVDFTFSFRFRLPWRKQHFQFTIAFHLHAAAFAAMRRSHLFYIAIPAWPAKAQAILNTRQTNHRTHAIYPQRRSSARHESVASRPVYCRERSTDGHQPIRPIFGCAAETRLNR